MFPSGVFNLSYEDVVEILLVSHWYADDVLFALYTLIFQEEVIAELFRFRNDVVVDDKTKLCKDSSSQFHDAE